MRAPVAHCGRDYAHTATETSTESENKMRRKFALLFISVAFLVSLNPTLAAPPQGRDTGITPDGVLGAIVATDLGAKRILAHV